MKKGNYKYIENILDIKREEDKIKKEDKNIEETKREEDKKEDKKDNDNENQLLKNKDQENNLETIHEGEELGLNFDTSTNPFTRALIGGAAVAGAGVAAFGGSIAACLAFDSVFLMSLATGEVFAAGWTFLGGLFLGGLGLIVAIPTLLGFGAYKLYRLNKEKKFKQFYENFDDDKKKVEREIRQYVIEKIDKYFNKTLLMNDKNLKLIIEDINNLVNEIIKIYINEDNHRLDSSIELIKKDNSIPFENQKEKLLKKLIKESKLVIKNFVKIRQEIFKIILNSTNKDIIKTFNEGIPFLKEFIKAFGPQQITKDDEKKIDNCLEKIISEIKKILEEKFIVRIKEFDKKTFMNYFSVYLREQYNKKKELNKNENIDEKEFISDCQDFIIEPVANNAKNWGILSFYMFFSNSIQNNGVKLKEEYFNMNREKIKNIK